MIKHVAHAINPRPIYSPSPRPCPTPINITQTDSQTSACVRQRVWSSGWLQFGRTRAAQISPDHAEIIHARSLRAPNCKATCAAAQVRGECCASQGYTARIVAWTKRLLRYSFTIPFILLPFPIVVSMNAPLGRRQRNDYLYPRK